MTHYVAKIDEDLVVATKELNDLKEYQKKVKEMLLIQEEVGGNEFAENFKKNQRKREMEETKKTIKDD